MATEEPSADSGISENGVNEDRQVTADGGRNPASRYSRKTKNVTVIQARVKKKKQIGSPNK